MSVLFVSYSPLFGGAERLLLDMAAGLDARSALACPRGALAAAAEERGLQVHPLAARRLELRTTRRDRLAAPWRLLAQATEVRRILRATAPRCVVGWSMRGGLVSAAALAGLRPRPAFVFQHNDMLPGPVVARAVRAAARRADQVSAPSRAIAQDLDPDGRIGPRLEISQPGVDLERFRPSPFPDPAAGQEVLVLGAVVPWKGPGVALEAAALAAARLPRLRLVIAGGPLGAAGRRLLSELRRRAERPDLRDRVRFAGQLADPRPALVAASCLLHCAEREPFGIALVEALACGRPVVAPAAGGPPEIVDASCGRLYAPGDARAAADALVEVLESPRRSTALAAAARARAEERFSLEAAQERFRRTVAEALRTSARLPGRAQAPRRAGG